MQLCDETVNAILARFDYEWVGEYGEPGYDTGYAAETPLLVLGHYWCRCGNHPHTGQPKRYPYGSNETIGAATMHGTSDHHPRVFAQLKSQGVQFEWCDEWWLDYDHGKAYRTQADSYSWQSSIQYDGEGHYLTPDDDIDVWLAWAVDDYRRCLPSRVWGRADLEAAGFVKFNGDFESGWYPGQNDTPSEITRRIHLWHENVEVVYLLDATGQFDIGFSAWIRPREEET